MSYLTNFTNVIANGTSFNGTSTPVAGVVGTFGSPEILGIAGIIIILVIGMKMKVSPDLLVVSCVTMLSILTNSLIGVALLPEWIMWIFILGGGVVFGLGLLKIIKNR
jgi:hypothetical protein